MKPRILKTGHSKMGRARITSSAALILLALFTPILVLPNSVVLADAANEYCPNDGTTIIVRIDWANAGANYRQACLYQDTTPTGCASTTSGYYWRSFDYILKTSDYRGGYQLTRVISNCLALNLVDVTPSGAETTTSTSTTTATTSTTTATTSTTTATTSTTTTSPSRSATTTSPSRSATTTTSPSSSRSNTTTTTEVAQIDDGTEDDDFADLWIKKSGSTFIIAVASSFDETEMEIFARAKGKKTISWTITTGSGGTKRFATTRNLSGYRLTLWIDGDLWDSVRVK